MTELKSDTSDVEQALTSPQEEGSGEERPLEAQVVDDEQAPASEPQEEAFEVLDEEARTVSEASERPAVGGVTDTASRDDGKESTGLVWMFAVLVIALIAWFVGSAIHQIRRDIDRLDAQMGQVADIIASSE